VEAHQLGGDNRGYQISGGSTMGASCAVEADGGEFYFGLGTDERERRRVSEWRDVHIDGRPSEIIIKATKMEHL
jgi:hypothetical protein